MTETQLKGLRFALGRAYFVRKDFESAKAEMDKVFFYASMTPDDYFYVSARLMYILCLFELGQLNDAAREVYSFKRKSKRDKVNLKLLDNIIKNLNGMINTKIKNKPIKERFLELQQILDDNQTVVVYQRKLEFLNTWLKEKLQSSASS